MNIPSFKFRLCFIFFLLAVLGKFWLIRETEIIDDVDDSHEYVLQILHPLNGGLDYGPGTGWVGRLFYEIGIPFRLGMELLFIFATVLTLKALLAWPWASYLSLGLFLFTIFDPATASLFSQLYSDQIWLVETMLGFSCLVFALRNDFRPNWLWLNLAALFLGLSTVTRSVLIPLLLAFTFFAFVSIPLILVKSRGPWLSPALGAFLLSLASLLLGIGIIYEGTCTFNLRCHGYFGISVIDSPELKKFYFCLQSVGEPTGETYFPIDENRRKLIAQAGPTSKWFIAQLEKDAHLKQVGLEHYGKSDIAGSWLPFGFFNAILPATQGDLRKCFALFETIENEIAQSARSGLVPVRPVVPLPDCRVPIVLAAYPSGLLSTVHAVVSEPPAASFSWSPRYEDREFTAALTRRVVHESPFRERIWRLLCAIYSPLYTSVSLYFYPAVWLGFLALVVSKRHRIAAFPFSWMARQLFSLLFLILMLWYALFAASGWPAVFRYTVYNHVMLPILICYYLAAIGRLFQNEIRL